MSKTSSESASASASASSTTPRAGTGAEAGSIARGARGALATAAGAWVAFRWGEAVGDHRAAFLGLNFVGGLLTIWAGWRMGELLGTLWEVRGVVGGGGGRGAGVRTAEGAADAGGGSGSGSESEPKTGTGTGSGSGSGSVSPLGAIRAALRAGDWRGAADRLEELRDAGALGESDGAVAEELRAGIARAREAEARRLRDRLDAARSVMDLDAVLDLKVELVAVLDAEASRALGAELSGWMLRAFHQKLRSGVVNADVARLAARMAEVFDDRPEGAAMRAALPTLRRSAKLCPRCAEAYAGVEDACPKCLAGDSGGAGAVGASAGASDSNIGAAGIVERDGGAAETEVETETKAEEPPDIDEIARMSAPDDREFWLDDSNENEPVGGTEDSRDPEDGAAAGGSGIRFSN